MYILFTLIAAFTVFDLARGYRKAKDKQGYLLKSLGGLVTVLAALFLFGPFFMISPIKIGYDTLRDDRLVLFYPTGHRPRAEEILAMARQAQIRNDSFYHKQTTTQILIGTSNLDILRFGAYPQANGAGIPWGIIIRESKATPEIIAHEMSHKNLSNLSFLNAATLYVPRWFDEGLASYIGNMDYYQGIPELREELQRGRYQREITSWKGPQGNIIWIYHTFYGAGSRLIYGQAYNMIKYLADTYGKEKIYLLIQKLPGSFESAFNQTYGMTTNQFHQEFMNFIRSSK